jgi:hypothetical protein
MYYYRKKKNASIIKTLLMGIASFISTFILFVFLYIIFAPDDQDSKDITPTSELNENNKYGRWTIHEYVNEFDEPTGEKYLLQISKDGSFSNSATTDSELIGEILIDDNGIRIRLKEYASRYAKDEEHIAFKVKKDGEITELGSFNWIDNQGYINLGKDLSSTLLNLLLQGGDIKFYGSVNSGRSTYNFTINGDHLKDAMNAIGIDANNTQEK